MGNSCGKSESLQIIIFLFIFLSIIGFMFVTINSSKQKLYGQYKYEIKEPAGNYGSSFTNNYSFDENNNIVFVDEYGRNIKTKQFSSIIERNDYDRCKK